MGENARKRLAALADDIQAALAVGAISYDGDSWYAASDEGAGIGYEECERRLKAGTEAVAVLRTLEADLTLGAALNSDKAERVLTDSEWDIPSDRPTRIRLILAALREGLAPSGDATFDNMDDLFASMESDYWCACRRCTTHRASARTRSTIE